MKNVFVAAATFFVCLAAANTADPLTQPIKNSNAAIWNRPQAPMRLYGDSYYVGVAGLSSVLIRTEAGSILIDGAMPQSVALIEANIRKLGFNVEDIKFVLNSHAHPDHAGGIAALVRDSGATAVASPAAAKVLRTGRWDPDDPQAGDISPFPPVNRVREIHDGETLRLGQTAIVAHFTPGHSPGGTSWTWDSCERGKCLHLVFADSLSPVSVPGFHFLADAKHPDLGAGLRKSIQIVRDLPCDILISAHPDVAGVDKALARAATLPKTNPFIDAHACRDYADLFDKMLDARIAEERARAVP